MKGRIFFLVLSCLLITLTILSTHTLFFFLLFLLWSVRCLFMHHRTLFFLSLFLSIVTALIVAYAQSTYQSQLVPDQTSFYLESDSTTMKIDGDSLRFEGEIQLLDESKERVVASYKFSTEEEKNQWKKVQSSKIYQVKGTLTQPNTSNSIHSFDYKNYLKGKQIYWILEMDEIEEVGERHTVFLTIKEKLLFHIDKHLVGKTNLYLKALFLSDKREMDREIMDAYRQIGLIHLLSISGLHVHLFVHLIDYFLLRVGVTREKSILLSLLFIILYGCLLGWGTSVFRSVCQISLIKINNWRQLKWSTLDAWSMTMLLSIWLNPLVIFEAGYQLSYALSFLLIFVSQSFWYKKIDEKIQGIYSSILVFLFSMPILSYHFFEIPILSLILNVLMIPLFSVLMFPLFFILFVLSFLIPHTVIFSFLVQQSNFLITKFEQFSDFLSSFKGITFITGRLPFFGMLLLIFSLILMFVFVEQKKKKKRQLVFILCLFVFSLNSRRHSPVGNVTMVDVGQGEAIFISEPYGKKHYLIDTGGRLEFDSEKWKVREKSLSLAESTLIPFIKSQGIGTLDQVILTHSDADHVGTLKDLADKVSIKEVVATAGTWENPSMEETILSLEKNKIKKRVIPTDDQSENLIMVGPQLRVLWPKEHGDGKNNHSLVLYGKIGQHRWLFTGDIEEESEREFVLQYPQIQIDILKVAHHGSKTSTTENFVKHTQPVYALISSGRNNVYGHPHIDVLDRLNAHQVTVFQTAKNGTITYRYHEKQAAFMLEYEMNNE